MKQKVLFLLLALFASALFAQGIKYGGDIKMENPEAPVSKEDEAQMKAMGMGSMNYCEFEAMAQGGKYKMVYLTDFALFKKGSYMLGDANSNTAWFVFPDTKSYWEMNIDEMNQMASKMQSMVKMTYSNQSCTVTPLGPKVISGTACTGKRITVSYDTQTSMMGMKSMSSTKQQTDYYTNPVYDVLALFGDHNWHSQGMSIGDPVFDKQIAAKVGFLGFPMQVITETWTDGKYTGKTTMTTKDVQLTAVSPANFLLPSGYTRQDPGFGSMLKQMSGSREEAQAKENAPSDGEEAKQEGASENNGEEAEKSGGEGDKAVKEGKKLLKKIIKKVVK